ncbi:MAG: Lrp/AsnC family transcriptional regulator [Candidatus Woesearchaeota archaeon]
MSYKLDNLDIRLLKRLSIDCSESITQIAKKSRIARGTAAYRISIMEKEGIILKYKTIIDYAKIGLNYGRIAIKLIDNSKIEHEKIVKELSENRSVAWFASTEGKYDIIASLLYEKNSDFEKVITQIKNKHGSNIDDIRISILNKLHMCGNNFISSEIFVEPIKINYSTTISDIDELDKKIINQLSEELNHTIKICENLKINPKTFISRKKILEKKKIILGYWIEINKEYFDLSTYQVLCKFNTFDSTQIRKLHEYISRLTETEYVSETIGSTDYEFYLSTKDDKSLYLILNKIKEHFPTFIRSFEHILILKERKYF